MRERIVYRGFQIDPPDYHSSGWSVAPASSDPALLPDYESGWTERSRRDAELSVDETLEEYAEMAASPATPERMRVWYASELVRCGVERSEAA